MLRNGCGAKDDLGAAHKHLPVQQLILPLHCSADMHKAEPPYPLNHPTTNVNKTLEVVAKYLLDKELGV